MISQQQGYTLSAFCCRLGGRRARALGPWGTSRRMKRNTTPQFMVISVLATNNIQRIPGFFKTSHYTSFFQDLVRGRAQQHGRVTFYSRMASEQGSLVGRRLAALFAVMVDHAGSISCNGASGEREKQTEKSWFLGSVESQRDDGVCAVQFDDGDVTEMQVRRARSREAPKRRPRWIP